MIKNSPGEWGCRCLKDIVANVTFSCKFKIQYYQFTMLKLCVLKKTHICTPFNV